MNRHIIILRDLMPRDNGWGTDEGRAVGLRLLNIITRRPDINVFRVSLKGVYKADATFAREVLRRWPTSSSNPERLGPSGCLVDADDDHRDLLINWNLAATEIELPVNVFGTEANSYPARHIIGPQLKASYYRVHHFISSRCGATVSQFAVKMNAISISNISNKFAWLFHAKFVMRKQVAQDSGGVEYVYYPIL